MNRKQKKLKILFVSAEAAPFAKVGGLGDVAGALPQALKKTNVDIRLIMPLYGHLEKIYKAKKLKSIKVKGKEYKLEELFKNVKILFNNKEEKIDVYKTKLNNVPVYFINNKKFFSGKEIYHPPEKFLFFSKAIVDFIESSLIPVWRPDIIHCNDNHTALIPVLLKIKNIPIKTILTIHNLEFQGQFPLGKLNNLGVSLKDNKTLALDGADGDINKMVQGMLLANAITTVSPAYAKEILTKEYGEGLENILKKRKKDLYGIINGIDVTKFNPKTDSHIKFNYTAKNLKGKQKNKEKLIKEYFKSATNSSAPLIGLVSRLASQKGIDLVIGAIPKMFKKYPDLLFILLGTGLTQYEKNLKKLALEYPNNFKALIKFDVKTAQEIYAGCDMFLMPSKFEPCGLGQLIAMRYGTVTIARKTGGLADTIKNFQFSTLNSQKKLNANGFLFKKYSADAMLRAIDATLAAYEDKKIWKTLMLNGMDRDSSWDNSAKEYVKLYTDTLLH